MSPWLRLQKHYASDTCCALMIGLAAVLLALLPSTTRAAGAAPGLTDFRALVRFASPRFSPDGQRIAFVTLRADFVHDRYDASLRVIDTHSGEVHTLVRGIRDLHMPRWSPDGRTLGFIGKAGKQQAQIFTVPASGGTPSELSDAPNGVQQFSWSPDGNTVAYVTPDNSPLSPRDRHAHRNVFSIHDDDYLIGKPPVASHIWLLSLKDGKAHALTRGVRGVLEAPPPLGGGITAPSWSADGRWLAYTQQANADDSDTDRTTIVVVNVANGTQHPISGKHSYEYAPRFAPRGDDVAYLYPHGPGPVSAVDLFVGSISGREVRDVSVALDRNIRAGFSWLPDGRGLLAMADDHVGTRLYIQPLDGKGYAVPLGNLNPLQAAVSIHGALAVVADSATQAPELYLLRTPQSTPMRLTDFNRRFDAYAYPVSREVRWHAPDGEPNDGILTYPLGYQAGKRYPLVLYSHGGPEGASSEHFDAGEIGPLRDLFAARGFAVFEPNYRGSDSLGSAHEHAVYRNPAEGPSSDEMSGLSLLQRMGLVDRARICAVGHSYGGYTTAWLISHQHFWRCAVVADGAVDWTETYELAGAGNLAWARDSLGGSPWDKSSAALYRTTSPINYAGQITTPTLILSGTADVTIPITESFALYHALQSRKVPVSFIGIPGAHHLPQDPVHLELYYRAIDRWVVKYLGH